MLIQMLIDHPQILGPVIKGTPSYVWGLLAGLTYLGLTQVKSRTVGLARITLLPIAMTALSLWGTIAAFGASPLFGYVLLAWATAAAVAIAAIAPFAPPAGTQYDAASRSFKLVGSWAPMALIMGIFLTKYIVGVDLAMQPTLASNGQYTLVIGTVYGAFSGIFAGRTARLWSLAFHRHARNTVVFNA